MLGDLSPWLGKLIEKKGRNHNGLEQEKLGGKLILPSEHPPIRGGNLTSKFAGSSDTDHVRRTSKWGRLGSIFLNQKRKVNRTQVSYKI